MDEWIFEAGEPVPQWLEATENLTLTWGTRSRVVKAGGCFEVFPLDEVTDCVMRGVAIDDTKPASAVGVGGVVIHGKYDIGVSMTPSEIALGLVRFTPI